MKKNRAIFLDRDGTIINNIIIRGKPYPIRKKKDFKIKYGAINKLNFLAKFFHLIIISNQPDFKNYGFYNLQNHIDNNIREKIPEIDIDIFMVQKKQKILQTHLGWF